jgi:hypothetical protein
VSETASGLLFQPERQYLSSVLKSKVSYIVRREGKDIPELKPATIPCTEGDLNYVIDSILLAVLLRPIV